MTVTELAILPLQTPLTSTTALPSTLLAKLRTVKDVLEKASCHTFYYFQQVEDPSILYILGTWSSVSAHHIFLPSPENQSLLQLLKNDIKMEGLQMWHLEGNLLSEEVEEGKKSVLKAPTISCNRHFVPKDKKAGFERKFGEVKGVLEQYTLPFEVRGGWRIEQEQGMNREEWVLFSGFGSVNHHSDFAKTEEFVRYREIVGFVEGFEVKHLKALKDV